MCKRIFCGLLVGFIITGCTYHGQIRRGLYVQPPLPDRINASVLVVTDRNVPREITVADPGNDSQLFVLQTADGVAVAATDALGTLFTRAEAGSIALQAQYDFIAQVTLASSITSTSCQNTPLPPQEPGLCTLVSVSISPVGREKVQVTAQDTRWKPFRTPGVASSVRWLDKHTRIFFPILAPWYVQTQGNNLRNQFEQNLTEALQHITEELSQRRTAFTAVP